MSDYDLGLCYDQGWRAGEREAAERKPTPQDRQDPYQYTKRAATVVAQKLCAAIESYDAGRNADAGYEWGYADGFALAMSRQLCWESERKAAARLDRIMETAERINDPELDARLKQGES